ncbi:AraC family transcriptional regulator [Microbacterium sp. Root61]|uniref:helix-turn-helix domain-containing protein n=1 Tax=Microbacterium sp. Root61 TaxID=1736570 RepID=UPI0007016408|nr:helix-turn-helix domain-containing protein [Microbacterium sp. Root61]KRA25928.1 AraC family transcriptional regulator [Microbacterium sp. Root61]
MTPPLPEYRTEGFADQRLGVLPRPQADAALVRPGTRRLLVTDAGFFPVARGHRRLRALGSAETIVIVCVGGRGTVAFGGEGFLLTTGVCIAIPAATPHEYLADPEDPWTIWWLHARGSDVAELTAHATAPARLRTLDRVVALFDELVSLMERRLSPAQLLAASGVAWNLLARIAADVVLPAEGSAVERAMRYLETRIDGEIPVAELAGIVEVSPSHLSALFRQATGGGPGAFHTSLKMARARELLDTSALPVGEVASAVGYADPLYFSRHFRRLHGVSPSTYRAQPKG